MACMFQATHMLIFWHRGFLQVAYDGYNEDAFFQVLDKVLLQAGFL
jgi:hypothetical protein